jgi:hypothetical protein
MRSNGHVSWTVVCALTLGTGCASLTPAQDQALREAQAFADATTSAYGVGPVRVVAGPLRPGVGATFGRGVITLNQTLLASPFLDVLMAHELGHAVLGHEGPVPLEAAQVLNRRELDANGKAVEILVRIRGRSEAEALGSVLDFLGSVHATGADRERALLPVGHPPVCAQIEDLLRRFPRHRYPAVVAECVR